jgi:phosphoribosylglycinamide formyltransferase-1
MSGADHPRLVVVLSGRGSNLAALCRAVESGNLPARIAAAVSDRPDAAGLVRAREAGIDAVSVDRARHRDRSSFERSLAIAIDGFEPHYILLAGFMRVLGERFVERYRGQLLNIHPSLLPRHRGLYTHRRALEAGDREHGASVHFVTPALDAGPVISQARIQVRPGDTADALADRLLPLEHVLYPATVALLLRHRVELRDDTVTIDKQALERPLVLGTDLGDDGRVLGHRDGG